MGLLHTLLDSEGFESVEDFIEAYATDSIVPGLCRYCHNIYEYEPDSTEGWCESCGTNSVVSGLILAGVI